MIVTPSASPLETAAIVAAIERYERDRAAAEAPPPRPAAASGWQRAARLEAVGRDADDPGW